MRRQLHTLSRATTALVLLLLLAVPAAAQDDDTVTVTFGLTLYGDAPEGDAFYVSYNQSNWVEGRDIILCGTVEAMGPGPSGRGPECDGEGTTYTDIDVLDDGAELNFFWVRRRALGELEIVHRGTTTLGTDTTYRAFYDYRTGQGGLGKGPQDQPAGQANDDQQEVPDMPDTGLGGMAGTGLPLGSLATVVSVLIAGGYALLRRR